MTYAAASRNLSVTFGVISDGLEVFLRILENHFLFSIALLCCSELMTAMKFYLYYRFGFLVALQQWSVFWRAQRHCFYSLRMKMEGSNLIQEISFYDMIIQLQKLNKCTNE